MTESLREVLVTMNAVLFIVNPLAAVPPDLVITQIETPPRFESSQRSSGCNTPSVSEPPARGA